MKALTHQAKFNKICSKCEFQFQYELNDAAFLEGTINCPMCNKILIHCLTLKPKINWSL